MPRHMLTLLSHVPVLTAERVLYAMESFTSVRKVVSHLAPVFPVHAIRPHVAQRAASYFQQTFSGTLLFAVKTNNTPELLETLYTQGISHFDVASLEEIQQLYDLFGYDATLCFMHTVKPRHAITQSYHNYGVRDFALDNLQELQKILEATNYAKDLNLYIRLATPSPHATLDLSHKFGAQTDEAIELLKKARQYATKLGICFHVGSQCMNPEAYRDAILLAEDMIKKAEVEVEVIDVGGGFPSLYPDMAPPPLDDYMRVIRETLTDSIFHDKEQWCEPGRALVAEAASMIVNVILRKENYLYINDGTYGSLFDAGYPGFRFPVQQISDHSIETPLQPFHFYGPTCDGIDSMAGPFYLPESINEGHYIEIGQLGAYGHVMRTAFNGFSHHMTVITEDEPLMSMYSPKPTNLHSLAA